MSQCPQLPVWVCYLQALAVPLLAVAVALFGVLIAWWQACIAHRKYKNDEFFRKYEKRFEVYAATREFLASVFSEDGPTEDSIRVYGLRVLDAQFLFDDALFQYLKELHWRVTAWAFAKSRMGNAASDEHVEYQRIRDQHIEWIRQQGDGASGFDTRFRRFLKLRT
jgi:hypothetical protein